MAVTIAIYTFDEPGKAKNVLKSLKAMERENKVALKDAAIIVKDEKGKVKVQETDDVSTGTGVLGGGLLGLIIGIMLGGPIGGLVVGGLIGAFTAKKIDLGISNEKIKSIADKMGENSSALLLELDKEEDKDQFAALIRESGGHVVEFDISDDAHVEVQEFLHEYSGHH